MNKSSEDGTALICMPDITGFTRFMAETDIEFSRKIIPPLLRNIVTSNTLNLKVGEIEGDAILFYRFGSLPSLKDLTEQCINFYLNFNKHLESLKNEFPEEFEKYISPSKLALKIVLHAAEITSTNIEGNIKLIGEDMVVVHKLLKNTVKESEYILLTEKLLSNYTEDEIIKNFYWFKMEKSEDEYEYIGSIKYRHISLEPLLNEMKDKSNEKAKKESA
jgi:uncharacterized protein DUF2652